MREIRKPNRRHFIVRASAGAAVIAALDGASVFPAAAAASVKLAARGPQPVPVMLHVNGTQHALQIEPRVTLLDALRERIGLTGTKKGCDQGTCGACTVIVDGKRVNACLTLAIMSQGKQIATIEGLANGATLHPMQAAFLEHDGFQCGYCTPGQILSAVSLLAEQRPTDDVSVREWMSGNICRCGAYANIIAAVRGDGSMRFIAGGTNIIDLMKDGVERPRTLLDITPLALRTIDVRASGVRLGALTTMADAADAPAVKTGYPVVSQALLAGASPQLRNMATLGGNIMQRTRCAYFRDVSQACNKRSNGTGCAAIAGQNRNHAVIGTSAHCICTHPSDFAVALLAVDALVHVRTAAGLRTIPIAEFHVLPGDTPSKETVLHHGDLIESIELPAAARTRNSTYVKVRDRASYEFALVSVAAALEIANGTIRSARVALGGVAPKPWRSHAAEEALIGKPAGPAAFAAAANAATAGMHGYGKNDFKITLAQRTVIRALAQAGGLA